MRQATLTHEGNVNRRTGTFVDVFGRLRIFSRLRPLRPAFGLVPRTSTVGTGLVSCVRASRIPTVCNSKSRESVGRDVHDFTISRMCVTCGQCCFRVSQLLV